MKDINWVKFCLLVLLGICGSLGSAITLGHTDSASLIGAALTGAAIAGTAFLQDPKKG